MAKFSVTMALPGRDGFDAHIKDAEANIARSAIDVWKTTILPKSRAGKIAEATHRIEDVLYLEYEEMCKPQMRDGVEWHGGDDRFHSIRICLVGLAVLRAAAQEVSEELEAQ